MYLGSSIIYNRFSDSVPPRLQNNICMCGMFGVFGLAFGSVLAEVRQPNQALGRCLDLNKL